MKPLPVPTHGPDWEWFVAMGSLTVLVFWRLLRPRVVGGGLVCDDEECG